MKKKLSKEQLNERKAKLRKSFHILAYISLALNILFGALFVYSCAAQPKKSCAAQPQKQYRSDDVKQDIPNIGFDLRQIDYGNSASYNGSFSVALDNAFTIGTIDHWIDAINQVDVTIHVNGVAVTGDYISYSINDGEVRTYTYDGSQWVSSGPLVTEILYVNLNQSVTNDISVFLPLFGAFFIQVDYDYYRDLTENWSPLSYFNPVSNYFTTTATGQYSIINSGLFAINGVYYTDLLVYIESASNTYWQVDGEYQSFAQTNFNFVGYVMARNSKSNKEVVIMMPEQVPYLHDNVISFAYTGKYVFRDYNLARIYQFNFNYDGHGSSPLTSSVGYNNGNALKVESNYIAGNGAEGQFGDVFGLIGTAFNGLTNLLSITILPGITLGVFIMLPLVALIIFAILRVVKK